MDEYWSDYEEPYRFSIERLTKSLQLNSNDFDEDYIYDSWDYIKTNPEQITRIQLNAIRNISSEVDRDMFLRYSEIRKEYLPNQYHVPFDKCLSEYDWILGKFQGKPPTTLYNRRVLDGTYSDVVIDELFKISNRMSPEHKLESYLAIIYYYPVKNYIEKVYEYIFDYISEEREISNDIFRDLFECNYSMTTSVSILMYYLYRSMAIRRVNVTLLLDTFNEFFNGYVGRDIPVSIVVVFHESYRKGLCDYKEYFDGVIFMTKLYKRSMDIRNIFFSDYHDINLMMNMYVIDDTLSLNHLRYVMRTVHGDKLGPPLWEISNPTLQQSFIRTAIDPQALIENYCDYFTLTSQPSYYDINQLIVYELCERFPDNCLELFIRFMKDTKQLLLAKPIEIEIISEYLMSDIDKFVINYMRLSDNITQDCVECILIVLKELNDSIYNRYFDILSFIQQRYIEGVN